MANEVGFNTKTLPKKRWIIPRKLACMGKPSNISETDDVHFTSLCFTTMTAIPVLMVTIIGENVQLTDRMVYRYDEYQPWIRPEDNTPESFQRNLGIGKIFIGGPSGWLNGVNIPILVLMSPKGDTDPKLLTDILQHIDNLNVFEQALHLPLPALLLDDYGSHFGLEFLTCVLNKDMHGNKFLALTTSGMCTWDYLMQWS